MRSLILFIFLIQMSPPLFAQDWTGVNGCGIYQVKGIGHLGDKGLTIIVNEKTQSEFQIKVPTLNEAYLAPYIKRPLEAKILIDKKPNGVDVTATIKEIKSRIPNPLNPMDTGIKLISKAKCK